MPFYEVVDSLWEGGDRWYLEEPALPDGSKPFTWAFTGCRPFTPQDAPHLRMAVQQPGPVMDFTFAAFNIPVLSPRAVEVLFPHLTEFCEFIPVEVSGQGSGFQILNVLSAEDCVDEAASKLLFWLESDDRPDKVGTYRQLTKLVLKPTLRLAPIFRLEKFRVKLLVNHQVAELFRRHRLSGVDLEPL